MGEIKDPKWQGPVIGPDPEIEKCGQMYAAVSFLKTVLPDKPVPFCKFVEMNAARQSNAWAYLINRSRSELIYF